MENKFGFLLDIMFSTTPLPLNALFNVEIQCSLQLADTVAKKKKCPLIGKCLLSVRLLESFSISVLISSMKHFSISVRCSWVD